MFSKEAREARVHVVVAQASLAIERALRRKVDEASRGGEGPPTDCGLQPSPFGVEPRIALSECEQDLLGVVAGRVSERLEKSFERPRGTVLLGQGLHDFDRLRDVSREGQQVQPDMQLVPF